MRSRILLAIAVIGPVLLKAQSPTSQPPADSIMFSFQRFADLFGSRLVAAFDSIPAGRYDYRPMPTQQSVGYIAQHVANANNALCDEFGDIKHARTPSDTIADVVQARWPKDTLVAQLRESLRFCDTAIKRAGPLTSAGLTIKLLNFETDLAEHYSQLSVYMRLLGMVPPTALPIGNRVAIGLPLSALAPYVGVYQIDPQTNLDVTMEDGVLFIRSTPGGSTVRLYAESTSAFFVVGRDVQITFTRNARGAVTGLVAHISGRDSAASKIR